jgi:hypothetical protein
VEEITGWAIGDRYDAASTLPDRQTLHSFTRNAWCCSIWFNAYLGIEP